MLIGEFRHNLDPKGRITIPSKFREDLSVFVMTKGLDDCLFLYPKDQWEKIENKLKELPMTNKAVRSFVRTFFSGAVDCVLDKQGRVLIAENLRDYANLEDKCVIIGLSNRAEVWSEENWNRYNEEEALSYEELAEKMKDNEKVQEAAKFVKEKSDDVSQAVDKAADKVEHSSFWQKLKDIFGFK